jgi:hypothetical protein
MARPQATISEGASCARLVALIFGETSILENGFAMTVGTCVRRVIAASTPGIAAQPPDSTICATWL